jgi:small subunit ribosomal protein S21
MTQVLREQGEAFEGLLRRFKKAVQQDRVLTEIRRRRFYEKPSQERKRQAARKLRKSRKTTQKDLSRR